MTYCLMHLVKMLLMFNIYFISRKKSPLYKNLIELNKNKSRKEKKTERKRIYAIKASNRF